MTATDRALTCPSCKGTKAKQYYVCPTCWFALPSPARAALNLEDTRAFRRLSDLLEQLRNNVPLEEIEINA
jgi:hypothetical protein